MIEIAQPAELATEKRVMQAPAISWSAPVSADQMHRPDWLT